jgi:hypothetical protein
MTTTDQLRKDINKLNDKIEKLERKNDTYEKQLNEPAKEHSNGHTSQHASLKLKSRLL